MEEFHNFCWVVEDATDLHILKVSDKLHDIFMEKLALNKEKAGATPFLL